MVREIVDQRTKEGYPNPEEEKQDLARMEEEAQELTMLAGILVKKVQDGYTATRRTTSGRIVLGDEAEGIVPAIKVEDLSKKQKQQQKEADAGADTKKEADHTKSVSESVAPLKTEVMDSSAAIAAEIDDQVLLLLLPDQDFVGLFDS